MDLMSLTAVELGKKIKNGDVKVVDAVKESLLRIEKLDDNCATFRVLIANETDGSITYTATDSFFTISLDCICVLKCLADTLIETL